MAALQKHCISGHPESNQGPSDHCNMLQSDALPTELWPAWSPSLLLAASVSLSPLSFLSLCGCSCFCSFAPASASAAGPAAAAAPASAPSPLSSASLSLSPCSSGSCLSLLFLSYFFLSPGFVSLSSSFLWGMGGKLKPGGLEPGFAAPHATIHVRQATQCKLDCCPSTANL